MTALEKIVSEKNVVAFQVKGQEKRDVQAIKDQSGLEGLKLIIASDVGNAAVEKGQKLSLGNAKGHDVAVTVYLEKDGVTAEDTYTLAFK